MHEEASTSLCQAWPQLIFFKDVHAGTILEAFHLRENWMESLGLRLTQSSIPTTTQPATHIPYPPPTPLQTHTHSNMTATLLFPPILALFLKRREWGRDAHTTNQTLNYTNFNSSPSIPALTYSLTFSIYQPTFNFLAASKVSERASNTPVVSPARRPNVTSYWPLVLQDPRRWISDINCGGWRCEGCGGCMEGG